jgi:hypothetical protein
MTRWDGGEPEGKLAEVNRYFEGRCRGLVSVEDPSLPDAWYGGNKYLEACLFIGAFDNRCLQGLDGFLAHLRSIRWECPESVQVFVLEQDDDRFRLIDVMDGRDA